MTTLILDSATEDVSVILTQNGKMIASYSRTGRPLPILHDAIEQILLQCRKKITDLERVVVVQGPGSWTGLHVAIATAKTISQMVGCPISAISFLDALAQSNANENGVLCAMMDARQKRVYAGLYAMSGNGMKALIPGQLWDLEALVSNLRDRTGQVTVVGSGAIAYQRELSGMPSNLTVLMAPSYKPEALVEISLAAPNILPDSEEFFALSPLYMQADGAGPKLFSRKA